MPVTNFAVFATATFADDLSFAGSFHHAQLLLSPELPLRTTTDFLEAENITLCQLGLSVWSPEVSWKPISDELIKEALEIVLDAANHPLMVMCSSGIHRTGVLVGCLRRMQQWALSSIISEYRMFASPKERYVNEQFIELFDTDLVNLPPQPLHWFTVEQRMLAEDIAEIHPHPFPALTPTADTPAFKKYYFMEGVVPLTTCETKVKKEKKEKKDKEEKKDKKEKAAGGEAAGL